jgi:hypothetical protein
LTPKTEKDETKINSALNAAFAFWVAKSTMSSIDLAEFLDWANNTAALPIDGSNMNKGLISALQGAFPGAPPSFPDVLEKAQELSGTAAPGWDPHHRTMQILNAISEAGD